VGFRRGKKKNEIVQRRGGSGVKGKGEGNFNRKPSISLAQGHAQKKRAGENQGGRSTVSRSKGERRKKI